MGIIISSWLIGSFVLWIILIYCLLLTYYPWLILLLLLGIVCYSKGCIIIVIDSAFIVYLIFSLIVSIDFTASIIIWDTLLVWSTLQIVIILIIVLLLNISIITHSIWSHLAWIWSSKLIVKLLLRLPLLLLLLRIMLFYSGILLNIVWVDIVLIIVILIRSSWSVKILLPSKLILHVSLPSWMKLTQWVLSSMSDSS